MDTGQSDKQLVERVKRYGIVVQRNDLPPSHVSVTLDFLRSDDGVYVMHSDYEALEQRLTAALEVVEAASIESVIDECEIDDPDVDDADSVDVEFTVGQLRKLRAALAALTPEGEGL